MYLKINSEIIINSTTQTNSNIVIYLVTTFEISTGKFNLTLLYVE